VAKTIAPKGKYRIVRLIEDDGEFFGGGEGDDRDTLEDAKKYADELKVADAKEATEEGGEELALADTIFFAVYDDTGQNVHMTDPFLGLG